MSCLDFERWLDAGRPAGEATAHREHGETCGRCAPALRAALELDDALGLHEPHLAPAGFTDDVMRRVRDVRAARAAAGRPAGALPWWLRAALDPQIALAVLLCGLLAWRPRMLWALASGWSERVATISTMQWRVSYLPHALASPVVQLGLWLVVTPAMVWFAWQAWRWIDRVLVVRPLAGVR